MYQKVKWTSFHEQQDEDGQDVNDGQGAVPPPKQLTLERQLNKSILIG